VFILSHSKIATDNATEALRLPGPETVGMRTTSSHAADTVRDIPPPSLPAT
jgi:hypothetical protein